MEGAMTIEVPEELEGALKAQAELAGMAVEAYVESVLAGASGAKTERKPLKSCYGLWAKYGIDLSAEDIDENRRDMFKNFGEGF